MEGETSWLCGVFVGLSDVDVVRDANIFSISLPVVPVILCSPTARPRMRIRISFHVSDKILESVLATDE